MFFPLTLVRTLYIVLFCFVLSVTSPGGARNLFYLLIVLLFRLFICLYRSCPCHSLCIVCTLLHCNVVYVSWFLEQRPCITLGGRIGADTGCAGYRRVEKTV